MKNEILNNAAQSQLVADLRDLVEQTLQSQTQIESEYDSSTQACRERLEADSAQLEQTFQESYDAFKSEYLDKLVNARHTYESEQQKIDKTIAAKRKQIEKRQKRATTEAKFDWSIERRAASRELDETHQQLLAKHKLESRNLKQERSAFDEYVEEVTDFLRHRGYQLQLPDPATGEEVDGSFQRYQAQYATAENALTNLQLTKASRYLTEHWTIALGFLTFLATVFPIWLTAGLGPLLGVLIAFGIAVVMASVARFVVARKAQSQAIELGPRLATILNDAQNSLHDASKELRSNSRKAVSLAKQRSEQEIAALDQKWQSALAEYRDEFERASEEATATHERLHAEATAKWEATTKAIREAYVPMLDTKEQDYVSQKTQLKRDFESSMSALAAQRDTNWTQLTDQWNAGHRAISRRVDQIKSYSQQRFPDWSEKTLLDRAAGTNFLPAVRIGEYELPLVKMTAGQILDEQLENAPTHYAVPSFMSLVSTPSLMIYADAESPQARSASIEMMQLIMLRFMTAFPAGKVRLTIIDPEGLGRSFSAFMHLADFDERLISERIWTEQNHINRRLEKITEHMESVIQKNLRNEFATIHEYNDVAGEVTVPFHLIMIDGFPTNFTPEAAERLAKIVATGPQCGVYTVIRSDHDAKMPRNFDVSDITKHTHALMWSEGSFRWDDVELAQFPLIVDPVPNDETTTKLVREVGRRAKDAIRVEVPFSGVAPADSKLWSYDSRNELVVPIGRFGAKELQKMRLGKGTSQHVLIAGKTGSGKSTLLHVMITNLALHYSPNEVRFYLIDFKKGVEFKAYAEHNLPHARVIAIESEREFGLSVLQKLDLELQARGELFREAGVQSVAGYRDAHPEAVLPRLLLMIDEFQELFVKEDKIAHEAALLLDRLIRQGRAFGMHVILGSQSLSGAYTLARSTLGQMAIRVALQCSEVDARLILSDENDVARLLNRPGDAVYNDANGLAHGNYPFQVVWLGDEEKVSLLQRIQGMAEGVVSATEPAIVFEGNAPADAKHNVALRHALQSPAPTETPLAPRAWLGNPVAIKDPPAAVFHRRSGSSLLVVGQQTEAAQGILMNAIISVAAFAPLSKTGESSASQFFVLDGDSTNDDLWQRAAEDFRLDLQIAGPREMESSLHQVHELLEARQAEDNDTAPPVFLIISNLGRFRGLEPQGDDFGLGSFDKPESKSADKQFVEILRQGPPLGIHTMIWAETSNQVNRYLNRRSLNDLDLRILFHMSANDSSRLMDSADASQLGLHRALLYRADQGQWEKLWPYQLPSREWWTWVQQRLGERFRKRSSSNRSDSTS